MSDGNNTKKTIKEIYEIDEKKLLDVIIRMYNREEDELIRNELEELKRII